MTEKRPIRIPTEEEERANLAAARSDPDNPPLTEEQLAGARLLREVRPDLVRRMTRGPQKAPTKELISLRLDRDVLERFKAGGKGWQTRINDALRKAVGL